jgi:uncharacterized membrane protein YbhN (UPF0104 family)
MVGALLGIVGVMTIATIALRTFSAIDADVADSASKLPAALAISLSVLSGFGQLVLPGTVAIALLNMRRARLLAEATGAFVLAALAITLMINAARTYGSADFWFAISGTKARDVSPLQPLLAGVLALLTVARLRGGLATIAAVIMSLSVLADVVSGGFTATSLAISVLTGWAMGLAFRYAIGTPTTRPRGAAVADVLIDNGLDITELHALASTDRGRRYLAIDRAGKKLQIVVFDRDLEGSGIIPRWWRSLRLRDPDALGGWTMREAVERASLMAYSAQAAGAPVPQLHLVRSIGPDACVLAYDWIDGPTFENLKTSETEISDEVLRSTWQALKTLHESGIAHRGISLDHIILQEKAKTQRTWLVHITSGTVAMSDLQQRIDIADMLIALALVTDAQRAVTIGTEVMGIEVLTRALPALQPFAIGSHNRKKLRKHKQLLGQVRENIVTLNDNKIIEDVSIERLSPRKVLSIVGGLVAGYILLGQLAQVDLLELFRNADYSWVLVATIATIAMFIGSAMTLDGFVVEKLSFWKTFLTQVATAFVTLVSPPALGTVAVNGRYLQKEGLSPAAAGATVAVSQVLAFFVHIGLLFAAGIAAGTQQDFKFDPPREAVIVIGLLITLAIIILPLPMVRKYVINFARPRVEEVIPRLVTIAQRPSKLAIGVGGMVILNVALCVVLIACVRAFGGGGTIAAISLVFLAGSTLAQAAPTPGGVGAVETVLTAGLVATGVDGGIAVSAVLLYRLLTFWLPTIPGWFAFQHLIRRGSL